MAERSIQSEMDKLPELLRERVGKYWEAFLGNCSGKEITEGPEFLSSVCRVWAVSEFVAEACVKDPDLIVESLSTQ